MRWLRWEFSGRRSLKLWAGYIHSLGLCHSTGKYVRIQSEKSRLFIIKCLRNEPQFCSNQSKWLYLLRTLYLIRIFHQRRTNRLSLIGWSIFRPPCLCSYPLYSLSSISLPKRRKQSLQTHLILNYDSMGNCSMLLFAFSRKYNMTQL